VNSRGRGISAAWKGEEHGRWSGERRESGEVWCSGEVVFG
jgi:hypothetical protein